MIAAVLLSRQVNHRLALLPPAQAIKKMALLHRVWISSCLIVLLLSYAAAHQSKTILAADILINGDVQTSVPSDHNPLLAQVHMTGGESSSNNFPAASADVERSLNQQAGVVSAGESLEEQNQQEAEDTAGFSALQASEEAEECSCVFAGVCLYKGACLWIAAVLSLGTLVFLFLVAWALQWVVSIPAEWILAKKRLEKVKGNAATDSTPLL
ncbi:hypothetical protein, conserved [Eimeria tenella]|uniref:Transmembrane protein n=1 Tax=Eimeria tenella TaxID=5802 RepID=U6KTD3_EIMTE|nr:hypothetical protein, conserved [Eimeria tenella]CDJ39629.1 hypothetical protein, conserved [Eimeria tenella]|eukprot:XP_013230384.1 hypothetical protein, conserved [Eimeria tenella]